MSSETAPAEGGDCPGRGLTRRALIGQGSAGAAILLGAGPATEAIARGALRAPAQRSGRRASRVLPTLGTELEYYRMDPDHIEARLALCAAAGYTTIQTYVPWNVHENTRGVLDFTGQTHPVIFNDHADEYQIETPDQEVQAGGYQSRVIANTDLLAFIAACERHGFKVILRPGPFISDEWRNGGLPDWLGAAYPDMFMLGPDGSSLEPGFPFSPPAATTIGGGPLYYFAGPSYASPDYLREVAGWMTAFVRAIKPKLATRGGPVVSLQVDDEICFYYRFGPFEVDYHPAMLARYGQPAPTAWPATGGPVSAMRPALHWQRFKAEQLGVFLGALAKMLRDAGADVPITHEEELQLAPPANFAQLAAHLDVLHPEFYLDPAAYSVPTIELCAAAVRAAQRRRRDVYACEMSSGDVLVRHLLTGEGITGFLGFTYTTGIDEGSVADMSTFDRAVRTAGSRIVRSDRVADTAIVWPPEYMYLPYGSTRYGFEQDVRGAIEFDIPALALLLVRAGLSFDLLDTDVAQPGDYDAYPTIWLVGADVLPRSCQRALIRYVKRGGRLICWPAPPTLDEEYAPCTELRDQLFGEAGKAFHPADGQTVTIAGHEVQVWRGVQTYALSARAVAVARRGSEACGYTRRAGRGSATLIGTWPVADAVAGRIGDALETQDAPAGSDLAAVALNAVAGVYGAATAALVDSTPPPDAGSPQTVIVFDYTNERRGGEVISGGAVAYWDGENVAPIASIDTSATLPAGSLSDPQVTRPPYRPVTPAHLAMARALHGRRAACEVSDPRIQARVLKARDSAATTISLVNRYGDDVSFFLTIVHEAFEVRLPFTGKMTLPAGTGLLLPLDYDLGPGLSVEAATVQLLEASVATNSLKLATHSFGAGQIVVQLPGRLTAATVDGRPARTSRSGRSYLQVALPGGTHELSLRWR